MTTVASIPRIHPMLRRVLAADTRVAGYARDRVFAGPRLPEGTELPAVNINLPFLDPIAAPSASHWTYTGEIECVADTWDDAEGLGEATLTALLSLIGAPQVEGVVIDVFNWGIRQVEAVEWTPPRPQNIVTVTITARAA